MDLSALLMLGLWITVVLLNVICPNHYSNALQKGIPSLGLNKSNIKGKNLDPLSGFIRIHGTRIMWLNSIHWKSNSGRGLINNLVDQSTASNHEVKSFFFLKFRLVNCGHVLRKYAIWKIDH